MRRRFRASNYQTATRVKPFICTMPLRLDDGWNQVQFNLSDFVRRAYGTNYVETLRITVGNPLFDILMKVCRKTFHPNNYKCILCTGPCQLSHTTNIFCWPALLGRGSAAWVQALCAGQESTTGARASASATGSGSSRVKSFPSEKNHVNTTRNIFWTAFLGSWAAEDQFFCSG